MKDEGTLRFPARDLKPYAEYVRSKELVLGDLYFAFIFWTATCSCLSSSRSCSLAEI